jgi:hypothetical protein
MKFGLPEEPTEAEIVEGPTPEASGYVVLKVRVDGHVFRGLACPLGHGADMSNADLPTKSKVTHAVHRFMDEHQGDALGWYREAARLRRLAGNPPLIGASTSRHVSVVGQPESRGRCVVFRTQGAPTELRVIVFEGGGVTDDCDDWRTVTDIDRDAATTAVLDHIFENREESAAFGIDVELLEELYR